MKRFIEHESLRAGQPRPYADSIYEGYLTFSVPENQAWASKWPTKPEEVEPFAKLLVHNWFDPKPDGWHLPRLKTLEQVSKEPNKWHVVVISPYLD